VLSLTLCGCFTSHKKPIKVQWGKVGEQPTAVWTDYDWIIRALDE